MGRGGTRPYHIQDCVSSGRRWGVPNSILSLFCIITHPLSMSRGEGIYPDVGRQTPVAGAHVFLGQPNIFFVTVNAKDAIPWMADETVQKTLVELWSKKATAWLVGYYLIMPDHLHFFCAPHDLHFGIDQWVEFWKRQFSRRHLDQPWAWQ